MIEIKRQQRVEPMHKYSFAQRLGVAKLNDDRGAFGCLASAYNNRGYKSSRGAQNRKRRHARFFVYLVYFW